MYEQYAARLCWFELMHMAPFVSLDYHISKRDVPVSSVEAALIKLYYFHVIGHSMMSQRYISLFRKLHHREKKNGSRFHHFEEQHV
jgi:hypothetical protein